MLINELARKYKITIRTLRYYEQLGLLTSTRNQANIRDFAPDQVERLELIILFKMFNFNLTDIKELLDTQDETILNEKLKNELQSINKEINQLTHKKQLINSLLSAYGSKDISKSTVQKFIETQLYFKPKDERTISMLTKSESILLEIGTDLIPLATKENKEPLLQAIHDTRQELESRENISINLIRVKDNTELEPLEYRIYFNNKQVYTDQLNNLETTTPAENVQTIMNNLKPIMLKSGVK